VFVLSIWHIFPTTPLLQPSSCKSRGYVETILPLEVWKARADRSALNEPKELPKTPMSKPKRRPTYRETKTLACTHRWAYGEKADLTAASARPRQRLSHNHQTDEKGLTIMSEFVNNLPSFHGTKGSPENTCQFISLDATA
jgi:hypothetical protein